MAFSSCFCHSLISLKIDYSKHGVRSRHSIVKDQISSSSLKSNGIGIFGQQVARIEGDRHCSWSFLGGSRIINRPQLSKSVVHQKPSGIRASWLTNSQIANGVFSLGTVAVLPFYTLMVVAPKAELTRKTVESSIPYIVLGLLYAYLLFLSWTPDTFRLMFASKYWLPEIFSLPACLIQLPGIAKMFSSDMTLASAWIHLLAVDLFAARHVFQDGLQNEVETRHSVSLCLLFCPIGIFTHFITKALTKQGGSTRHGIN